MLLYPFLQDFPTCKKMFVLLLLKLCFVDNQLISIYSHKKQWAKVNAFFLDARILTSILYRCKLHVTRGIDVYFVSKFTFL